MNYNLDFVILKTLISNKKYALDFANECDSKLFSPETWNFANVVINYIKTYKEVPTLRVLSDKLSKLNNDKFLESFTKTWETIENISYDDKEYKYDLEKLKKRFAEKQILSIKEKFSTLDAGSIDINKAIVDMQKTAQSIKDLNHVKTYERKTLKDAVPGFREEYNAKKKDPVFDRGIKTGYSAIDSLTDGLRGGELLLIGGESGAGKSTMLMNMAIQLWMQNNNIDMEDNFHPGNNVLYFSLEMPFKSCLNRVFSKIAEVPSKSLKNASLSFEEAVKIKKSLKFISKYPFQFEIIDIPRGATMESMELIYEDVKINYEPKIVVIDYLGLMDYSGAEVDDWIKLGKIAEKIHEFARVHNLIVLSAVQLNRVKPTKGENEGTVGLHRIGRSALIVQNANIAIQIETRQKEKTHLDMIYHIIKNRDGALGEGKLIKKLDCATLLDDYSEPTDVTFFDRDANDISEKLESLDI